MVKINKKIQDNLLDIDNVYFYFDFDALGEFVKINPKDIKKQVTENEKNQHDDDSDIVIDISKYEMMKTMIDIVMAYGGDIAANIDMDKYEKIINKVSDFDNTPLAFKLGFNTLLVNKILVKYEPTN